MKVRSLPAYYSPIGHQTLTVSSAAIGFTLPASPQCRAVIFTVESGNARFWVDGTSPTSAVGMTLYVGDIVEITNVDMINKFLAIRVSVDSVLNIQYFGGGV
jgi:hypothetical protein